MNFYVIVVLLGSFHHLAGIASDNVSYYIIEILRFLFVKQLEGLSARFLAMLQFGDELTLFSVVFVVVLLGTRSAVWPTVLTASLYLFLVMFRFPQVPSSRARQVLRPASGASAVAHRGGGHDAPENTIAAIRAASENGAMGVELDLEFTADGVPILMHDDTVDRTTNGSGPLSKLLFSELRKLDAAAKHRFSDLFRGEKVPTLQEAVEECIKRQLTIYFDVKGHPDEAAAALKELFQKYPVLYNTSIVCSFEPKVIYRTRQADPNVVTALTHRPWSLSRFGDGTPRFSSVWKHHWMQVLDVLLDWAHHHLLWNLCGVSAFLVQKNFVSPDYVQYWAARGVEVVGWTVNTAVEKQYYEQLLKITYITDSLVEDCEPHY
uniref:Glycerophosphodiester phosphodiesterase 1 n=3 Tax=Cyprinus carpio TaxID=7962 RepID=A0A9J8D4D7_CYPCA